MMPPERNGKFKNRNPGHTRRSRGPYNPDHAIQRASHTEIDRVKAPGNFEPSHVLEIPLLADDHFEESDFPRFRQMTTGAFDPPGDKAGVPAPLNRKSRNRPATMSSLPSASRSPIATVG